MTERKPPPRPQRLTRERVLRAAVEMADAEGIDAVSMRTLADRLGVVPMALYKHVAGKDELLDGMVDVVVAEIAPVAEVDRRWKQALRNRILTARQVVEAHPWARRVIETRTARTATVLAYLDSIAQLFLAGGLSPDLTHHAMHALGSRVWGFTQDVFDSPDVPHVVPERAHIEGYRAQYPSLTDVVLAVLHDDGKRLTGGCDGQFEFEFALDLLLDGIGRLHAKRWTSNVSHDG